MSIRIWFISLFIALFAVAFSQQTSVITEIEIKGNEQVTADAILLRMRTKQGQPYVQATLDQDRLAIEQMGFFKAVNVRAVPLEAMNWKVVVEVSEFPVVKEIRIVGNTVISTEEILKAIPAQVGQPFNLGNQRPTADKIFEVYAKKGFFALVEQLEPLEDSPGTLSIVIREMTVGTVGVQGNTRTKSWVMQRLIKTRPSEIFNIKKWDDDLRRVYGTQWFEKVVPIETDSKEGFAKDLVVDVKEARTGTAIAGISVDPRSSFAGSIRLADTNFRGTGQTVGVSYLQVVTGGGASLDLEYANPFIDHRDTTLNLNIYSRLIYRFGGSFGNTTSPTDERLTERRTGGSFSLSRPLSSRTSGSVGLRFESIRTGDINNANAAGFIKQDGTVAVASLGWNKNNRDVDIDPARGDWALVNFEPGYANITRVGGVFQDPAILGTNMFVRATGEYRTYFSPQPPRGRELDAPRRVFAFRARGGAISGTVPFFEQYFVGGSDSVRGYEEDRFWGKQFLTTSLEYRHPIQKSFNATLFVDYGGAWGGYGSANNFTQSDRLKLNLGYGFGFSFRTPLGPIRLDFGWNQKGGSRTHFMIGTTF